jgi:uncharacterized membrane protein YhaH (DUF805 family)
MSEQPIQEKSLSRFRNYWIFSAGIAIVLAIVIILRSVIGGNSTMHDTLLIVGGFAIGWVATTIARYIYPPARRWQVYYRRND